MASYVFLALCIFPNCTVDNHSIDTQIWTMEWYLENNILNGTLTLYADSSARLDVQESSLIESNEPVWFSITKDSNNFYFSRKDEQLTLQYKIISQTEHTYTCLFADEVIVKIER